MRDIDRQLSDAAKRASDTVNSYRASVAWDELRTKWIAVRLDTGESDGILYDSKRDAVKRQLNEFQRYYISFRNLFNGSNPRDMAIFLQFQREAYDRGFRLPDPDDSSGGPDVLMTTGQYEHQKRVHAARTNELVITDEELNAFMSLMGGIRL